MIIGGDVNTIDLYVNGTKVVSPNFTKPVTDSTWAINTQFVKLDSGTNVIQFNANSTGLYNIFFDNITVSSLIYDFSCENTSTSATTPPALNITMATGNNASAGVVSYTDADNATNNCFRAYSGGQRNRTGVVNLDLFPTNATDYSVTWKKYVGSSSKDYKAGVLLRGTTPAGGASSGYVQGIMQGYLFIVNNVSSSHSEFRIYKSTTDTNLNRLVNNIIGTLVPPVGQPVWYRATVSGSTTVSLKFEYSTDSVTWNTAATVSDESTSFVSGATQIVWGLGVPDYDFYLDDISFSDYSEPVKVVPGTINFKALSKPKIISTEYYDLSGRKVYGINNLKGAFIVKNKLSNRTVTTNKLMRLSKEDKRISGAYEAPGEER